MKTLGQVNYESFHEGVRVPKFSSLSVRLQKRWQYAATQSAGYSLHMMFVLSALGSVSSSLKGLKK